MANRKKKGRIFWREQGRRGCRRAYGDFRDYADVGGRQEALVPPGTNRATDDPIIAEALVAERLRELQERRRDGVLLGTSQRARLGDYVKHHITEKRRAGRVTQEWAKESERELGEAMMFFGSSREIASITVADVQRWYQWLGAKPGRAGTHLSGGTIRHHLNSLSNLYRRAAAEGLVTPGYNPVAAMLEKPVANRREARWLEVNEAALLLAAAREYKPRRSDVAIPFIYPLLATFLLTGGRESEVLGLQRSDVSFERESVTFRPNRWRRLKTNTSHRTIPLWPQLRAALQEYLDGPTSPRGDLLFPATRAKHEQPLTDLRKALDAVAASCGWSAGQVRSKMFRHSYCTARLQTLDRGQPVSLWTVAREMGHSSTSLVERTYGHLGTVRERTEVVQFVIRPNV